MNNPLIIPQKPKFEVIAKYNGDITKIANSLGIESEILNEAYAILTLNAEQLALIQTYSEVEYIELPKILTYFLTKALTASCITQVQQAGDYELSGKGVLVGIIDSGIDYTHPDFRNPDGTTRILYIWDQTVGGTPPAGFSTGNEYTAEMLNEALKERQPYDKIPRLDTVGHGTAVSGVAAGNGRASGGRNKGVATEAALIVVRLGTRGMESFARTTEVMRAIKYLIDKATALNMPLAMNLSYGTNNGSHDGNSLFETYIDSMLQRWKTVLCVASGNEGSAGHHYLGVAEEAQTINVDFVSSGSASSMYMTLWKDFVDTLNFELIAPNGESTGIIRSQNLISDFLIDNVDVRVFYGQPTHYNDEQEIYFLFEARNNVIPEGVWRLRVTGIEVVNGIFNIWLPVTEEVSEDTAFSNPNSSITLTIPSTAEYVITVGGYNSIINAAADFSGRGYTRNIVYVKPDLVAPAVDIITAQPGGGYDSFSGTSIAAPFVTGAAALMMEWGIVRHNDNFLYGQRIKAYLRKGANRDFEIAYPNPTWGYGTLCLKSTMDYLKRGN